jgi:hypothetical protein
MNLTKTGGYSTANDDEFLDFVRDAIIRLKIIMIPLSTKN